MHTLIKVTSWQSSSYKLFTWRIKSLHEVSHVFSSWTIIARSAALQCCDKQWRIILLRPIPDIQLTSSNRLMCFFVPLQFAYSKAVAKHLKTTRTGVSRALFWGFLLIRADGSATHALMTYHMYIDTSAVSTDNLVWRRIDADESARHAKPRPGSEESSAPMGHTLRQRLEVSRWP